MFTNQKSNRSRHRGRAAIAGAAVAAGLVGGALGVAAIAGASRSSGSVRTQNSVAPSTQAPEREVTTEPTGQSPVSGSSGEIVGYIDNAESRQALAVGEPVLPVGSGRVEIRGLPVKDEGGHLVGYFLSGQPGFVPLDIANDPDRIDAIAEAEAKRREASANSPVIVDANRRMREEASGS